VEIRGMAERKSRPEVEIIDLPNVLKEKVGSGDGTLDLEAITRAEAALGELQEEWHDWLNEDVGHLLAAYGRLRQEGLSKETLDALHRAAHDLKGLAPTYEYPLIGRIAASLCDVLTHAGEVATALPVLIEAHVDAMRAALHEDIRDAMHPQGDAIVKALAELVRKRIG
jgi:chemotaxis protein histidine kinase CheA